MSDVKRYGHDDGLSYYWIRKQSSFVGDYALYLAAIDQVGEVTYCGAIKPDDPEGFTEAEAVHDRLTDAIKQADRREMPERPEPEPEPEPRDPATERFLADADNSLW